MIYYNGYVFTKEECKTILDSTTEYTDSVLGVAVNDTEHGTAYQPKKRKSTQCLMVAYKNSFIYNRINEIIGMNGYEFIVDKLYYDVIKYNEGDFIWKHMDGGGQRIFTLAAALNAGTEYGGGDFKYWVHSNENTTIREAGYGILFKSDTYHEVTTITSGVRYSFVLFIKNNEIRRIGKPNLF